MRQVQCEHPLITAHDSSSTHIPFVAVTHDFLTDFINQSNEGTHYSLNIDNRTIFNYSVVLEAGREQESFTSSSLCLYCGNLDFLIVFVVVVGGVGGSDFESIPKCGLQSPARAGLGSRFRALFPRRLRLVL